jgi:hypothetical protein
MLAVAGYLLTYAGVRLPGLISYDGTTFADIPPGIAALDAVPATGIAQIVGFIGFLELAVMKDITGGEFVGDFRNGYLDFGWDTFDAETKLKKRAIELNNGRAAQMGILALVRFLVLSSLFMCFCGTKATVSLTIDSLDLPTRWSTKSLE